MRQNGQGLVSPHLDQLIGLAVMLLIFELIIHLLFSLLGSAPLDLDERRRRLIVLTPFLLFVAVLSLWFLMKLLSGLSEAMKEFRRRFFRRD